MIQFQKIAQQKKQYLSLLLLADEQESMIDRYLEQGTMYVMQQEETVIGVCVVLPVSETELEVKNLAIAEEWQGNGYGRMFLEWIKKQYQGTAEWLILGTGDSPKTIPFYTRLYCKIYNFAIPAMELPVVALPPRAAVHTVLAKPMALQPLLAALQTTVLFAMEDSI